LCRKLRQMRTRQQRGVGRRTSRSPEKIKIISVHSSILNSTTLQSSKSLSSSSSIYSRRILLLIIPITIAQARHERDELRRIRGRPLSNADTTARRRIQTGRIWPPHQCPPRAFPQSAPHKSGRQHRFHNPTPPMFPDHARRACEGCSNSPPRYGELHFLSGKWKIVLYPYHSTVARYSIQ
jgi:hypothetical protein